MTPESFIAKWAKSELKERSACQEHFIDFCRLVGYPTPAEMDPLGESCPETSPFPEALRGISGKGKMNRDEGNEGAKEPALLSPLSPSSLLDLICEFAKKLNEARELWLNPPGASAAELKKRTMTNLYSEREEGRANWLNHPHRAWFGPYWALTAGSTWLKPYYRPRTTAVPQTPRAMPLVCPGLHRCRPVPSREIAGAEFGAFARKIACKKTEKIAYFLKNHILNFVPIPFIHPYFTIRIPK